LQNKEDIVVKYKSGKNIDPAGEEQSRQESAPKQKNVRKKQNARDIYIIAILLSVFGILLFLALISYTSLDESNASMPLSDIFGLLTGNEEVRAKADTTFNWLGLVGAMIAHFIYNNTFGYVLIFLPVLLILYAKSLFFKLEVTEKLIKQTIVFFLFVLVFSSLMGTFSKIEWLPEISKEWSGVIGQFISDLITGLIGNTGTSILLFGFMAVLIVYGINLNYQAFFNKLSVKYSALKSAYLQKLKNLAKSAKKVKSTTNEVQPPVVPATVVPADQEHREDAQLISSEKPIANFEDSEEPAMILRRNLNVNIRPYPSFTKFEPDDSSVEVSDLDSGAAVSNDSQPNQEEPTINEVLANIEPPPTINEPINRKNDFIDTFDPLHDEESEFTEPDTINQSFESLKNQPLVLVDDIKEGKNDWEPESEIIPDDIIDTESVNSAIPGVVPEPDTKRLIVTVNDEHPVIPTLVKTSPICNHIYDESINYQPPPLSLLKVQERDNEIDEEELKMNARILQEKLETFKIFIENLAVTPGPVVTQYEFIPAAGIKISRIESLADDLAMALKARGIRIIAPIPGKGTIGIEIPNQKPSIVRFSSIVNSPQFYEPGYKLPLAFGKTISGDLFIADLAKMPHLLIAGSTGAGKSVGINTIIASLIYKIHPRDLKFIIIDPKKVELQQYSALENHFMAASPDVDDIIITNPKDAVIILNSVVAEMEKRYDMLASVGQRNIIEYNTKVHEGKFKNSDLLHRPMPYLVVIIDELADLMITASKEIEEPITRLAQMARAVGIHLVVATQRPSVDVITGIIKANFPARLAYLVAQKVDSRTILDAMGAEQLLGNGDMLFLPNGQPKPVRIQNSFISTEEVDNICEFIGNQEGYSQPYMLPSLNDKKNGTSASPEDFDRDPLFEEAARLLIRHQQGSVSLIQRRLKVGYARAGRIVDELESAGVVGPYDGSKARAVLMESETDLERIL